MGRRARGGTRARMSRARRRARAGRISWSRCAPSKRSTNDRLTRKRANDCSTQYHQYQVVGRHVPTDAHPEPEVFRMKLWALDDVKARSKFWYFMSRLKKVKKANGQIIACNEVRLRG